MSTLCRILLLPLLLLVAPIFAEPAVEPEVKIEQNVSTETGITAAEPQSLAAEAEPVANKPVSALADRNTVAPGAGNAGLGLGKMAISLAIVVVIVLLLAWTFKKLTLKLPGTRHIKIISTTPLGPRERILVIEIQGKQRVIGVTAQNINFLFELENALPEEKLAPDFHKQLQSFLKK